MAMTIEFIRTPARKTANFTMTTIKSSSVVIGVIQIVQTIFTVDTFGVTITLLTIYTAIYVKHTVLKESVYRILLDSVPVSAFLTGYRVRKARVVAFCGVEIPVPAIAVVPAPSVENIC